MYRVLGLSSEYKEGILFSTYATLVSSVSKGLLHYFDQCFKHISYQTGSLAAEASAELWNMWKVGENYALHF